MQPIVNVYRDRLFSVAWIFVIFVSVVDGYWVWHTRDVIYEYERNPFGKLLLEWNYGHVGLFLLVKCLGTTLACAILLLIYRHYPRAGVSIAVGMALFQLCLLMFLHFSEN
jgi:hypothetical protein